MNIMNVMNMWKGAMFMPYPTETKDRMNVMNVARRFFACRARDVPKGFVATSGRKCERVRTGTPAGKETRKIRLTASRFADNWQLITDNCF
jgi:hypothetical protein